MSIVHNFYEKVYSSFTNKLIVFFIIAMNPLIDVIYTITTKCFNLNLIINLNQILRMIIILIMFISIKNIKYVKRIMLFCTILLLSFFVNHLTGIIANYILDFSFYLKLLYGLIAFYWGRYLIESNTISVEELYNSLIVGTMLVSLIIIISYIAGIGLRSYADQTSRWGFKGLFTAQNVVALVNFVGLFLFNIRNYNNSPTKIIIGSTIYVLSGIIIGTKGSILFTFLAIVCLLVFYIYTYRSSILSFFMKKRMILIVTIIIALILLLVFTGCVIYFFANYYNKLDYFNSFYSFLVSGRDIQLRSCLRLFTSNFQEMFIYIPFGISYSYIEEVLMNVFISYHSLEQDVFAILLYTGVFGLIYILSTYLGILKQIYINYVSRKQITAILEMITFVLVMIYSFFIGHFLFESLACFFVWLTFSTFFKPDKTSCLDGIDNNISVIIRTYNEEEKLSEVLKLLKSQTYSPMEVIVVDSESTDCTVQIAREYGCKIVKIKKKDFNYSYASNIGANVAKGDILVYLSGHSIPYDIHYLEIINNIFKNKEIGGCYGDTLALKNGSIAEKIFNFLSHAKHSIYGNVVEQSIHQGILSCSNAAIRKKCWEVNQFDTNIIFGGEDVLMAYHIIKQGYTILRCPKMLVRHSHKKKLTAFKDEIRNWELQYESVVEYIEKLEESK